VTSEQSERNRLSQGKGANKMRIATWNGITTKLKTFKRGQKAELSERGQLSRRRSTQDCSAI
jgi:hypothetical protein